MSDRALRRQTSFAAGELSPTLYGRTEVPKYGAGLRTCKNFFISKHGAAVSRPGTTYVAETASIISDKNYVTRLVPFVFSDSISYVLEFTGGHPLGVIRFFRNGAVVGAPFEIETPYTQADTRLLRFAQVGNRLTVTHPAHPPYELVRGATDADWTFTALSFSVRPFESPSRPGLVEPLPTADADHPAREWQYRITFIGRDLDGMIWESAPYMISESTNGAANPVDRTYTDLPADRLLAVYPDPGFHVTLNWKPFGQWVPSASPVAYRIYRGRGALFGFIGETTQDTFTDVGDEPDYTFGPPQGRNPFRTINPDGTFNDPEDPTSVGYFEGRQIFGGTAERPGTVWLSTQNDYLNFDKRTAPFEIATDSVELTLASNRLERIRSVLGGNQLLVFTDSSVWAVTSGTGGPITPTDFVARVQSEVGASRNPPLSVAGSVLYARSKGTGVQDLFYDDQRRSYTGRDLSFLAQHLFAGHTILDWAYAEDPWGVVWVVRSDGRLLSLTYAPEADMWAWTQHETDGYVQAVCTVPEGAEDAVYFVVRRIVAGSQRFYLERMATRTVDALEDYVGSDCAIVQTHGTPQTNISAFHLRGCAVNVLADGNVVAGLTASALGIVTLPDPASKVIIGLPYTPEIETLDAVFDKPRPVVVKEIAWRVEATRGLWTGGAAGLWAGESPEHLTEYRQRVVADDSDPVPLHTGLVRVRISGRWNEGGRAVLKQIDPLPITVLGLTQIGDLGG